MVPFAVEDPVMGVRLKAAQLRAPAALDAEACADPCMTLQDSTDGATPVHTSPCYWSHPGMASGNLDTPYSRAGSGPTGDLKPTGV